MDDEGHQIGYQALPRGVPVVTSEGIELGTVHRVLDNAREHIFDGIIVRTRDGDVESGIKSEDTEDHVTLKDTLGQYHDIPADQIVSDKPPLTPDARERRLTSSAYRQA